MKYTEQKTETDETKKNHKAFAKNKKLNYVM